MCARACISTKGRDAANVRLWDYGSGWAGGDYMHEDLIPRLGHLEVQASE